LTFVRNPHRSCLSLQEREPENEDNIFIIYQISIHDYKKIIVRSYQVGSGQVLGYLVSSNFEFRVISGRVESGIRLSSVGSFWISGCITSGRVSGRIRSGRVSDHLVLGHFGFRVGYQVV
jgi:hypothetical protein